MPAKRKVVFGVFDWGLGHATRCKPLARALLDAGCAVDFISTGRAIKVLKEHFGKACGYHDVPSVTSPYTASDHFVLNFVINGPGMLRSLKRARSLSKSIIEDGDYDLVISDCRYDVYGEEKRSYLINHQLRFAAPVGAEMFAEAWLAHRMGKYRKVIVPDYGGKENLTGRLSHKLNFIKKKKIEYIGHISHIERKKCKKDIDYLISLTGPEPQRSLLEEMVFAQVRELEGSVLIAGGNPDTGKPKIPDNVTYHPYLGTDEMSDCLNRCKCFISRSGYTSMMELAEVGIREALLIPTPGQTEQEYLGKYYRKQGYFHSVKQKNLSLRDDVKKAERGDGFSPEWDSRRSVENFRSVVGV